MPESIVVAAPFITLFIVICFEGIVVLNNIVSSIY